MELTKREWVAAMLMQSLLANPETIGRAEPEQLVDEIVNITDKLLAKVSRTIPMDTARFHGINDYYADNQD